MGYVAEATDEPVYIILARMAEMYATGGQGVEKNQPEAYDLYNEAAEKATQLGKGRLANKYYMLAESVAV
jgi:TPR repeat protein